MTDPKPDWAVEAAEQVFVKGWEGGEPFIKYIAEGYRDLQAKHEAEVARLRKDLEFIERWAVYKYRKGNLTAQEALDVIANYPTIKAITAKFDRAALQEKEDG